MIERVNWWPGRCAAAIYKRDQYRRTGRGRSGFEMHYSKKQCSRKPVVGDLCKQHAEMENGGKP